MSNELEIGAGNTALTNYTWLLQGTEDLSLLVICMYLVTSTNNNVGSDGSMFSPLYQSTKRAFATLSCLSLPTMELIQCGTLIALFEFGHGRARFAYRTLSETLAMIRTAGIKPGIYARNTNQEIMRQTDEDGEALWWGIFILDQYVSTSSPVNRESFALISNRYIHMDPTANDLPLIVDAPSEDSLLPTEGDPWNGHSHSVSERRMPVNGQVSFHLGGFQRAAQAASLLNEAHKWGEMARKRATLPRVAEFQHLDKAIRSVLNAMLAQSGGWDVFCAAFATCMR